MQDNISTKADIINDTKCSIKHEYIRNNKFNIYVLFTNDKDRNPKNQYFAKFHRMLNFEQTLSRIS